MSSLSQVPGGPTKAQSRRFAGPGPGAGVSGKYTTVNQPASARSNEFPIVPFAPDKYDTLASIKQAVGDDDNDAFGNKWMVPFTDADAQYLLRQQAQVKNANYERWLWQQYDVTDPAQAWIFQQIAPEQFEKRKQLILYNQNLATKYALLRLYGVKTEEDLMLKYLVETKQIELPKGPIWDPKKWMAAQSGLSEAEYLGDDGKEKWEGRYKAGLFSALRYPTPSGVGYYPNATNRADALGWSTMPVQNQLFVGKGVEPQNSPYGFYGSGPEWAKSEAYGRNTLGFGTGRRAWEGRLGAPAAAGAGAAAPLGAFGPEPVLEEVVVERVEDDE